MKISHIINKIYLENSQILQKKKAKPIIFRNQNPLNQRTHLDNNQRWTKMPLRDLYLPSITETILLPYWKIKNFDLHVDLTKNEEETNKRQSF